MGTIPIPLCPCVKILTSFCSKRANEPFDHKNVAEAYESIQQATQAVRNADHDIESASVAMSDRFEEPKPAPNQVPGLLRYSLKKPELEQLRHISWIRANLSDQDVLDWIQQDRRALWHRYRCLEALVEARLHFDRVSRPALRPLTIVDMPTEILFQIIEWLQLGDVKSGCDSLPDFRLTCRPLSHIADNFLIPDRTLRLSLNKESLSRLEAISRHPRIRKTVKVLELDLSLFPDTNGVGVSVFASHAISLLKLALGKYDEIRGGFASDHEWPQGTNCAIRRINKEVGHIYEACYFLQKRPETTDLPVRVEWASMARRGSLPLLSYHLRAGWAGYEWPEIEVVVESLIKQAEVYAGLFYEQQNLLQGEFVLRLVTALSQMPSLDAIRFTEWDLNKIKSTRWDRPPLALWNKARNKGTVRFPFEAFSQSPEQPAIDILVQSKFLLKPLPMMRVGEGSHHLFSFMARLMDSLTTWKLSHVVKNLEIGFWRSGVNPIRHFRWRARGLGSTWLTFGVESDQRGSAYTEHQLQIRQATQNLESFALSTVCDNTDLSDCTCPETRMETLLSPFLQAPKLRKLNINHSSGESGYPSQPYHPKTGGTLYLGPEPFFPEYRGFIGRGLAARVSPFLCDITLKGATLHQRDFERFLRHGLEQPLHQLRLEDIKLQTGTWRSMLVFLRRLKSSESAVPKYLIHMAGAELLVADELDFPAPRCVSDFINGKDNEPNPIDTLNLHGNIYAMLRSQDEAVRDVKEREADHHDHAVDEMESSVAPDYESAGELDHYQLSESSDSDYPEPEPPGDRSENDSSGDDDW